MPAHHLAFRRVPSTAVSLRRWMCAWLALLLAVQMIGASLAGLHGALHRHRGASGAGMAQVETRTVRLRHDDAPQVTRPQHQRWHAEGRAHQHPMTDASVMPLDDEAACEAIGSLAALLAPLAVGAPRLLDAIAHVRAATPAWAASTRAIAPPRRPPRA
jgi:hypothetical protein